MGACNCHQSSIVDRGLVTEHNTGENLAISDRDTKFIEQNQKKVKSFKENLITQFRQNLRSIGEVITPDEFNRIIGDSNFKYSIEHPLSKQYEGDTSKIIEQEPIKMLNDNYYFGSWNEDLKFEGPGKYYIPEGPIFVEGYWKDGVLYYARIAGEEGIYEGEVKNSVEDGNGKMHYLDGREYEGEFAEGVKQGHGILKWPDGSSYWGSFENDIINGEGELIWKNGYKYKGDFVNGVMEGQGSLNGVNSSNYNGSFKSGVYDGKGTFTWFDPAIKKEDKKKAEKYDGEYKRGKKEGVGKYYFSNGDIYEGEWKDNKPHGQGVFETEKARYKSLWRNGQVVEDPIIEKREGYEGEDFPNPDLDFTNKIKVEDIDYKELKYLNFEKLNLMTSQRMPIEYKPIQDIKASLF